MRADSHEATFAVHSATALWRLDAGSGSRPQHHRLSWTFQDLEKCSLSLSGSIDADHWPIVILVPFLSLGLLFIRHSDDGR